MKPFRITLFVLLVFCSFAYAQQAAAPQLFKFININEVTHVQCSDHDGAMVVVESSNVEQTLEVQLDRYFMEVRQPGRSVVLLKPDSDPHELGCSKALADGANQGWKVVQVKIIEE